MRVLVLGGSRFIGRAVVDELLGAHDVTVLNRGTRSLGIPHVTEVIADRRDPSQVSAVLTDRFDAVVDVSGTEPSMIEGVLPAIGRIDPRRYVFVSTVAVYDRRPGASPPSETSPATGDVIFGRYGVDKATCEHLLEEALGERLVTLRPPYVFGPHNTEQREQFVWARLHDGQPIFVPGSGQTRIQLVSVETLAEAVALACEGALAPGTYNVAEAATFTFDEYVDLLARTCGRAADVRHVHDASVPAEAYFPFADADISVDLEAIRATGLLAERSLEEAMAETYRWFTTEGTIEDRPTPVEARWRASETWPPSPEEPA